MLDTKKKLKTMSVRSRIPIQWVELLVKKVNKDIDNGESNTVSLEIRKAVKQYLKK